LLSKKKKKGGTETYFSAFQSISKASLQPTPLYKSKYTHTVSENEAAQKKNQDSKGNREVVKDEKTVFSSDTHNNNNNILCAGCICLHPHSPSLLSLSFQMSKQ
jgi:hypothetical protein